MVVFSVELNYVMFELHYIFFSNSTLSSVLVNAVL